MRDAHDIRRALLQQRNGLWLTRNRTTRDGGGKFDKWEGSGKLKPSIRLLPTSAATTLHKAKDMVIDGPYAETKEALLGFYIIDVSGLDEGLEFARELAAANPGGAYELRPIHLYIPGAPVTDAYASDREYAGDKVAS
jgi:hypothetical protein